TRTSGSAGKWTLSWPWRPLPLRLLTVDIIYQAAGRNNFLHKFRKGLALISLPFGLVGDQAGIEVHLHLIPVLDGAGGLHTLDNRQTDIDGVAVEDPGKGFRDDAADSRALDGQGGVLS